MRAYCVRHIHSIWASLDEFPLDATSPSVSTEWYSYIEDTEEGSEGSSNLHQGQWRKGRDTWGRSGRQGLHGSPELCKAKGPLNGHTAESESIPGLSGNACLAAEDTVRVTHQAALPFFSLLQVWLFLKSPNFVGLLIFFFTAWKSIQQDYKHQFPSSWTSRNQHVEKGTGQALHEPKESYHTLG